MLTHGVKYCDNLIIMKNLLIIFIGVIIIGGVWFGVNFKKEEKSVSLVKIGAILPLSGGGLATYGESLRKAINLAVEQSGAKDKVQLIVEDDHGCQTKDDVTAAQKLIDVDKVQVLIGAMCTSPTLAFAPLAEAKKIVVVSPSASGKNVTEAGDYIFRTYASDADKSIELAKYLYRKGYRKMAIVHDSSQDASISQRDDTKSVFEKLGGQVVADEAFVAKDKDMRTQLNKMKSSGADIVVIGGLPDEIVLLLKQAREVGITGPMASTEGTITPQMIALAGKASEGLILPSSVLPSNKEVADFALLYKARYGIEPTQFAAEAYDATLLIIKSALVSDGSGGSIKANLEKFGQNYQGASGVISFDKNGDVKKPVHMQKVGGGKLVDAD